MKVEYEIKEAILDRLYERSSICSVCKRQFCSHAGSRELSTYIHVDDVVWAIDLDGDIQEE